MLCIATFGILNAQSVAISKPVLGFSFLCQSATVNTNHSLTFTVSPVGNLQASNQFSLELSNDDFTSNIIVLSPITVLPGSSSSQFEINFTLPDVTYGTDYKLRVKSSAPAATSIKSDAFDAFYMQHNQEIFLNTATGVDNVSYCAGSNYTLFIYDSGTPTSPLYYPNLTYTWYKLQGTNSVAIGSGSSFSVDQAGQYYVETNYGVCTPSSNSKSRIVTVTQAAAASYSISTSPQVTTICEGNNVTLSLNVTNTTNYSFQWFLDGNPISGANSNTYDASSAGAYKATVDNGSCVVETAVYTLTAETFSASLNIQSPYELTLENVTVSVSTDAESPVYQWFFNGLLTSETASSCIVTEPGEYSVVVTQTQGCTISKELFFKIQEPSVAEIPNIISPNGDGINDLFKIPNAIINQDVKLEILNASGKKVFESESYQNNWPESTDEVTKSGAIFYYVLSKNNQILKQGVLTVLR